MALPPRSTQVSQLVKAPRSVVYQAFLSGEAVAAWLAPDDMTGQVHTFEPHPGGRMRMSLTYRRPQDAQSGKTTADTDTFEGTFVALHPNERIVQSFEFESDQPEFEAKMRMTWTLVDAEGGTEVTVLCEDIPPGIRLEDNEIGSRQTLKNLATYVERSIGK